MFDKVYYSRNGQLVTEEQAKIIDAAKHNEELEEFDDLDTNTDNETDEDEGQ